MKVRVLIAPQFFLSLHQWCIALLLYYCSILSFSVRNICLIFYVQLDKTQQDLVHTLCIPLITVNPGDFPLLIKRKFHSHFYLFLLDILFLPIHSTLTEFYHILGFVLVIRDIEIKLYMLYNYKHGIIIVLEEL